MKILKDGMGSTYCKTVMLVFTKDNCSKHTTALIQSKPNFIFF